MGKNIVEKIISTHLINQNSSEITVKIDQTLTQDTTGTMAYLQLLAMGDVTRKTALSVAYIDHNTLQTFTENADDHEFIRTVSEKYKIIVSKAGNGICHQVHFERFAKPGAILIGSDSHTPTAGGIGMLAIGVGGLDVAVGIATGTYTLGTIKVMNIILKNQPKEYVGAKDIILHILKILSVKGGVGYIIEYSGSGLKYLEPLDRAVLTNMGAELGATSSIFPSDMQTYHFLKFQGREADYVELQADLNAQYNKTVEIDLSAIEPMIAMPHSPDNVACVENLVGKKITQVAIGSCTNSSLKDLMVVASTLKGKKVADHVSLTISPGSSSVLSMLADLGCLSDMIRAGARILEPSCGPCIGMGQSPSTQGVSLRTFNRNFKGRCGTDNAEVYLVSPLTATLSALSGVITVPTQLDVVALSKPETYNINMNLFIMPREGDTSQTAITMGPNIQSVPKPLQFNENLDTSILLKVGDNITTDDIVPSTSSLLPFRSNVPHLAQFCFSSIDNTFVTRAVSQGGGIIVAGENYGQGSSREHAALCPLQLNIQCVIACSFARIHRANLINAGIIPLIFKTCEDLDTIHCGDTVFISDILKQVKFEQEITILISGRKILVKNSLSPRERDIILSGGYLNYAKILGAKQ